MSVPNTGEDKRVIIIISLLLLLLLVSQQVKYEARARRKDV